MWDKIRRKLSEACDVMELFMALAVIIGLLIAITALYPELMHFWQHRAEAGSFMEFLDAVFSIVIGIEFMKMLCKPSTANIIEALIFLMARHMIIQTTTAEQDLLSVISICILFLFRRVMLATKPDKNRKVPNIFQAIKIAQTPEFREAMSRYEEENEEARTAHNAAVSKDQDYKDDIDDFRSDD